MKRKSIYINDKNFQYDKNKYKDGVNKLTREEIKKDLPQVILHIEEKDISSSFFFNMFGEFKGKALVNPYDKIYVPAGVYHNNKNTFLTTVGIYIFNVWFIKNDLFDELGYINKNVNKKIYNKINTQLSYALLEDRITTDQLKAYIEKTQQIMSFEITIAPNMDEELMTITKKIRSKRDKMFKDNEKVLNSGTGEAVAVAEKIEKELRAYAEEELKDCPGMDTYLSGGGASMENFKSFFIDKGIYKDPITDKYTMIKSNYIDGISAEDYAVTASSMTAPVYSRSLKTASGGYLSKLFTSAYQHLTIGKKGSDCGTKNYIVVELTPDNIHSWMYSYIIEGSHLVELTSKNKDKYIGKKVKMRFASMCESKEGFCNHCVGNLFYRLGIKNIGVAQSQIPERLKARMLAAFHVSSIKVSEMDINKAFNV